MSAVAMVRHSRNHPDLRTGSSVRGAIDFVLVTHELALIRGTDPLDDGVTLDAALLALSGRVRLREGSARTAEDVVTQLWTEFFGPKAEPATIAGHPGRGRRGKSLTPPPGGGGDPDDDDVKEGDEARAAVAEAGRRTTSRRDLARHERFEEVSPEVGEIDDDAFDELLGDDPDDALALLADMSGATDERLRELARRLAGRIMVDIARTGRERRRGVGRLTRMPLTRAEGDVDLDASLDAIAEARSGGSPDPADLRVQAWQRPSTAVCLLVDRSGSMAGDRLAAAAVAAASVLFRAPDDCSIVAFAEDAVVVKAQRESRSAEDVVGDLLRLRGFGVTDLGLALRAATAQLARSTAGRRIAILMSDCRATTGGDPVPWVGALDELVILGPEDDSADAELLASTIGARWAPMGGPTTVPAALGRVLLS